MSKTLIDFSRERILNDMIGKTIQELNTTTKKKNKNGPIDDEDNIITTNQNQNDEENSSNSEDDEKKSIENSDDKSESFIKKQKPKIKNDNDQLPKKIETFLLIIDNESAKIMTKFLTTTDIMNTGIFSIESIDRIRKPFPKSNAIYLIEPTEENCNKIINDFHNKTNPLYKYAHIFFTENIPEPILEKLVDENLLPRLKSCYNLNLSYYIEDKNVFTLGFKHKENLSLFISDNNDYINTKIQEISMKLFSVCSVLNIYPNIQYQANSQLAFKISVLVYQKLENIFSKKQKKGILLITDRTLDAASPAMHDYSYSTLVNDLLSNYISNKNEIQIKNVNGKLDYTDILWNKYKFKHFVKVFEKISEDFDEFRAGDVGKVGDQIDNLDNVEKNLQNVNEYREKNILFNLHLTIAGELLNKIKEKSYQNIIEHEQDILTGLDSNGKKIDVETLYENFNNLKNSGNHMTKCDVMRLLIAFLYSLKISEYEFYHNLAKNLNSDQLKIINGLQILNLNFADNNNLETSRRNSYAVVEKKKRKFTLKGIASAFKNNLNIINNNINTNSDENNNNNNKYNVLRTKPKIASIVEQCAMNSLNQQEFKFLEDPQNIKSFSNENKSEKKFAHNKMLGDSSDEDGEIDNLLDIRTNKLSQLLIYFNIGGLSLNEISSIYSLNKESKLPYKIVIGTTGIYSAKQYLEELINLANNNENVTEDNNWFEEEIEEVNKINENIIENKINENIIDNKINENIIENKINENIIENKINENIIENKINENIIEDNFNANNIEDNFNGFVILNNMNDIKSDIALNVKQECEMQIKIKDEDEKELSSKEKKKLKKEQKRREKEEKERKKREQKEKEKREKREKKEREKKEKEEKKKKKGKKNNKDEDEKEEIKSGKHTREEFKKKYENVSNENSVEENSNIESD